MSISKSFGVLTLVLGFIMTLPAMADGHAGKGLKSAADFEHIKDPEERGKAMFVEMGKVLTHPRCVNCHPKGESPLQGENMQLHQPLVVRGEGGLGAPGMRCITCHMHENYDAKEMPGHPVWHLAPASMAWEGKSLNQICEQILDPERNGGKSHEQLIEHMAEDSLVGWGWNPGKGREPVPGTQKGFGELFTAWINGGAHCPPAL